MSDGQFQISDEMAEYYMPESTKPLLKRADAYIEEEKLKGMTGVELIAKERLEHKVKHGRTIKFDQEFNDKYQLVTAAQALIEGDVEWMPSDWDRSVCEKMCNKSYKDRLIMAGALLAAELDRLNFNK